jgi:hypothetical protein
MGQLRDLIWSRLTGQHPAADVALEHAKAGDQSGIDTVATLLGVEMLDEAFAGKVNAIASWLPSHTSCTTMIGQDILKMVVWVEERNPIADPWSIAEPK